jgi:adenine-specific DNA-methyltransferase
MFKKPKLKIQTSTLWDYPSQHYGTEMQGDRHYKGATPSYVIWNLLQRYTRENDVVIDPMCGSGTTIDVCRDTGRKGMGFDIAPFRKDITPADARKLPLKSESIDFAFVDPPYSTHLKYSGHEQCIGELDAASPEYYEAMTKVIKELHRVLKDRRYMGLYVSDSWRKGEPFEPIGFDLFNIMRQYFKPVDIVAVVRHNKSLKHPHWHRSAEEGNYFLRGFNYLFIMKKENDLPKEGQPPERQIDSATPKK